MGVNIHTIVNRNAVVPNVNVHALFVERNGGMSVHQFKKSLYTSPKIGELNKSLSPYIMASKRMKKDGSLVGVGKYLKRETV